MTCWTATSWWNRTDFRTRFFVVVFLVVVGAAVVVDMTFCVISSLIVFISILSAVVLSKLLTTLSNDDGEDGGCGVLLVGRRVLLFWMHIVRCLLGFMILLLQKSGDYSRSCANNTMI